MSALDNKVVIHKDAAIRSHAATIGEIRQVWMLVSENPRITLRSLVKATGIKKTRVCYILEFLQKARYIKHQKHCTGRIVTIPFVTEQKRTTPPKE